MNKSKRSAVDSLEISRREFLAGSAALACSFGTPLFSTSAASQKFSGYPFTLGVASGDPLPDSIVLWTRLAPDPINGGGLDQQTIPVEWSVATDEKMKRIVRRGTAQANSALGHSIHVEAGGLEPSRWYWYQFRAGSELSPIGRTRTAPATADRPKSFSFVFASCQHYEHGYFTALRHLADEDVELVVHLGDYIYEGSPQDGRIRRHDGPEPTTVTAYRNRYALYKSDPELQLAHASFPWLVTWDDHEVENNYAGSVSEDNAPVTSFLRRRAAAYQAFYEHMPLRRASRPQGAHMRLYRRFTFGDLVEFSVLDTRQYRTDQPCGDGNKARCAAALDPKATLMGPHQERWLLAGLDRSRARWNIIAQQVMMAQVDRKPGEGETYSMDQWNGYAAARNRILGFLHHRRPSNPVVITGDIHTNWVADLKADFDKPGSATVGTEFVGTSITSGGDGADTRPETEAVLAENPHVKFFNGRRGYVRCSIKPGRFETDFRVVTGVTTPGASISTAATFVVEDGKPGAKRD